MNKPELLNVQASQRNKLSLAAVLFSCAIIIWQLLDGAMPNLHTWDLFGSYVYLPMIFEKHQLVYTDVEWMESMRQQYGLSSTLYQMAQWDNGNFITRNTCGWAILMLPFYLIAEIWAALAGYPTDGFSHPYQIMTLAGAVFYSIAGFLLLRKILLYFFSDRISAITLLLTVFGTNLLFTQYAAAGSTNNIEFFAVAATLYCTIRFHEKTTLFTSLCLAASLAILGLVRPPDLVIGIIPLFWNARQHGGVFRKIQFYWKHHKIEVIPALILAVFLFLLQIAYWRISTGELLINSYNNPGEGFDWLDPHLQQLLFSFRKGWFLYTPLMIFALIGLFIWARKSPASGKVSLAAALIFIYVASTWTNWWYAASFSQRSLIDIYPVMAVGLGFFIAANTNRFVKAASVTFIVLFVALNIFQTWQISNGIIHVSQMTRKYYFSVFGQTSPPRADQYEMLIPPEDIFQAWTPAHEKDYVRYFSKTIKLEKPFIINEKAEFGPVADITQEETKFKPMIWMKAVWTYEGNPETLKGKVFTWHSMHESKAYGWRGSAVGDAVIVHDTVNHTITNSYFVAQMRSKSDILSTSIWNQNKENPPLKITGLKIEAYRLKDERKYD